MRSKPKLDPLKLVPLGNGRQADPRGISPLELRHHLTLEYSGKTRLGARTGCVPWKVIVPDVGRKSFIPRLKTAPG